MKKTLLLLLICALIFTVPVAGGTEQTEYFHIAYACYDGIDLFGWVEIPDGTYFIRATFFMPSGTFFVVIIPISREGLFDLTIAAPCACASVSIVDSPSALAPGEGAVYKTKAVTML